MTSALAEQGRKREMRRVKYIKGEVLSAAEDSSRMAADRGVQLTGAVILYPRLWRIALSFVQG